ncbi:alkaline phosphatase [Microbacterium trichothecenolyticum]|uniref:Alkaline phosphatase n=1 Tax=Microbacterium trichothecenolyticum TaxID=69370 RepID=A0ABU0TU09_MICTR|nr:alkaline phosphatase [Microbacterium trichothecenolyticum]MDQ1123151.1 alkaline phosphatase [Microbacterium trichothecenolyticum]
MDKRTTGRSRRLIVTSTVAGLALGVTPAVAASAEEQETPAPRNVIVLISDGGGYNQFDAARLYETGASYQQVAVAPNSGVATKVPGTASQVYDSFPVQVGQSHYSASGRASYSPEEAWGAFTWVASGATDSAAAGTALGTGVKTTNGTLGFDPQGGKLLTVGEQALDAGKKVGLVTSVPFNHATPAGFIAHNASRNDYHGLAAEMIDSGVDVLIGGGHPNYTDANTTRASHFGAGSWISQADFERVTQGKTPFSYVESKADFERVAAGENVPDKLFGLARVAETFQYSRPGVANKTVAPGTDPANADVPSLATSARAALNVLEKDDDGFFLMVEGGAVDWAGHANQTTRIVEEQLAFNDSVEAVTEWVETHSNWDETLVVVTADHETGYLAGPGAGASAGWTALTGTAGQLPNVSWHSGGHTNALVPLYAKGAGSEVLQARATKWDFVRGAYLDNTDIGKTLFDLIGHGRAADGAVGVEASVPLPASAGRLSLALPALEGPVVFDGGSAVLPEITVEDTRNEAQAQGRGWTLAGSASAFVAGNRSFGAENLAWTPRVVSSQSGAVAGATATLERPSTLADADRVERVGQTKVSADLALTVPADAESGRYGSEITLTLFAKD